MLGGGAAMREVLAAGKFRLKGSCTTISVSPARSRRHLRRARSRVNQVREFIGLLEDSSAAVRLADGRLTTERPHLSRTHRGGRRRVGSGRALRRWQELVGSTALSRPADRHQGQRANFVSPNRERWNGRVPRQGQGTVQTRQMMPVPGGHSRLAPQVGPCQDNLPALYDTQSVSQQRFSDTDG